MDEKKIEIITGDGNIEISPAEEHINDINKEKKPIGNIIIPEIKKNENDKGEKNEEN